MTGDKPTFAELLDGLDSFGVNTRQICDRTGIAMGSFWTLKKRDYADDSETYRRLFRMWRRGRRWEPPRARLQGCARAVGRAVKVWPVSDTRRTPDPTD